jgi:hypothetical protein
VTLCAAGAPSLVLFLFISVVEFLEALGDILGFFDLPTDAQFSCSS